MTSTILIISLSHPPLNARCSLSKDARSLTMDKWSLARFKNVASRGLYKSTSEQMENLTDARTNLWLISNARREDLSCVTYWAPTLSTRKSRYSLTVGNSPSGRWRWKAFLMVLITSSPPLPVAWSAARKPRSIWLICCCSSLSSGRVDSLFKRSTKSLTKGGNCKLYQPYG